MPLHSNRASRRRESLKQKKKDRKEEKKMMKLDPNGNKFNSKKARSSKVSPQVKKNSTVSLIENPTVVQPKDAETLTAGKNQSAVKEETLEISHCQQQEDHPTLINECTNHHEKKEVSDYQVEEEESSLNKGTLCNTKQEEKNAGIEEEENDAPYETILVIESKECLSVFSEKQLEMVETPIEHENETVTIEAKNEPKEEQTKDDLSDGTETSDDNNKQQFIAFMQHVENNEEDEGLVLDGYSPVEHLEIEMNKAFMLGSTIDPYDTDNNEKENLSNEEHEYRDLSASEPTEETFTVEPTTTGSCEETPTVVTEAIIMLNKEEGEKENNNKEVVSQIKEDSINTIDVEDKTETLLSNKGRTIQENIPTPSITTATTISDKLISPCTSLAPSHKKKTNMISKLFNKYKEGKKTKVIYS